LSQVSATVLSEDDARELANRILDRSGAAEAIVQLRSSADGYTRFAANEITTSGDATDVTATLSVRVEGREASVEFNAFDDQTLVSAGERARAMAEVLPVDPELQELLEQQRYHEVEAWFEATAGLDPAARAASVRTMIARASGGGLVSSGFLARRASSVAVANTIGLFAYHRSTLASLTTTVRTRAGDGSGWAGDTGADWARMRSPDDLVERAVDKATRSAGATAVEPGAYTVVLEPTAAGSLLQLLGFAMDERAAEEGRSFFARPGGGTKRGEHVTASGISLVSDPGSPLLRTQPFTDDGQPLARTTWVEDGVLTTLSRSRAWADRTARQPIPAGNSLLLDAGGSGSTDDLVTGVERGLLVTRFWYIRSVDARSLLYTGLTRDGVFLIERGRVTRPVKNLRFNESVIRMLGSVDAAGAPVRVVASESGGLGAAVAVPPLVVRDFQFTALSDAV
jgi:predicted Zn-dependent protease